MAGGGQRLRVAAFGCPGQPLLLTLGLRQQAIFGVESRQREHGIDIAALGARGHCLCITLGIGPCPARVVAESTAGGIVCGQFLERARLVLGRCLFQLFAGGIDITRHAFACQLHLGDLDASAGVAVVVDGLLEQIPGQGGVPLDAVPGEIESSQFQRGVVEPAEFIGNGLAIVVNGQFGIAGDAGAVIVDSRQLVKGFGVRPCHGLEQFDGFQALALGLQIADVFHAVPVGRRHRLDVAMGKQCLILGGNGLHVLCTLAGAGGQHYG